MPDPSVNVLLHLQPGTGAGHNTAPPENPAKNEKGWLRAKSWNEEAKAWNVDSDWWFCYSGGNGANVGQGGTAGGEVDLPAGGSFSVGPSGQEVITSIHINESVTPPPDPSNYSPNPPTANDKGVYVISDTEHTDPNGESDSFDVYAKFNANTATVVRCDPIIRNK